MNQGQYICYMCGIHDGRHMLSCPHAQKPGDPGPLYLGYDRAGDPADLATLRVDPVVATFNTETWTREEMDRAAEALLAAAKDATLRADTMWTSKEKDQAVEAWKAARDAALRADAARSSALVGPCPTIDYRTASWFEINEELKRKDKTAKDQAKVREEHKRIGDTERNRYLDYLASRFASGHLTQDEFDDRKDQALTARTQLDLDILVRDLPPMPAPSAPVATQPSALAKQKKRGITNVQVVYWVSLAALWCCILVILSLVITG